MEVMAALEMQLAAVMVKVLVAVLLVFVVVGAARVMFTVVVQALEFMVVVSAVVGGSSNGVGSCSGGTAAQLRRQRLFFL